MITGLNHFTVTAQDREATLAFYCGLLGLVEGHRPALGFPGAWLYRPEGGDAVLHLYWDRPLPAPRTGVIDHMAFSARGLAGVRARLDAAQRPYRLQQQAGSGTWQLFVDDPNGAKVELDFEAAEAEGDAANEAAAGAAGRPAETAAGSAAGVRG